ncbi:MAG: hypothetical protein AB4290_07840 [Spirulina sp.]
MVGGKWGLGIQLNDDGDRAANVPSSGAIAGHYLNLISSYYSLFPVEAVYKLNIKKIE